MDFEFNMATQMLVTSRYWWPNFAIDDIFWMLVPDAHVKRDGDDENSQKVTNIWKLSPTHFVSNIRYQYRCSHFILWSDEIWSRVNNKSIGVIICPNRINLPSSRSQWRKYEWEEGKISPTGVVVRVDLFYWDFYWSLSIGKIRGGCLCTKTPAQKLEIGF